MNTDRRRPVDDQSQDDHPVGDSLNWSPLPAWDPLRTKATGDAWKAMVLALLAEGTVGFRDLVAHGSAASPSLATSTVAGLVYSGRMAGWLNLAGPKRARHVTLRPAAVAHLTRGP